MKEVLKVDLDDRLSSSLQKLNIRISSMQTLFYSFMNDKFDFFNKNKIAEFMDEYEATVITKNELIHNIYDDCIKDKDMLSLIKSNCPRFLVNFDFANDKLIVIERPVAIKKA